MGNSKTFPIGIFDSGLGGITVLRALYRQLPQESIIYFADTARLPYGNRTPEELIQYVREIITWMEAQGVKMVVMACNSSSAVALDAVRSEFKTPVLGLILPGAKGAVQHGKEQHLRHGKSKHPGLIFQVSFKNSYDWLKKLVPLYHILYKNEIKAENDVTNVILNPGKFASLLALSSVTEHSAYALLLLR